MKKHWPQLAAFLTLAAGIITADAGTLFYQAIPAGQTDASSGISTETGYTSAVDGGNTRGPDRVINGITLSALVVDGQTATADNCTLNALAGTLSNAGGSSASVQAEGIFRDVLSDMTFNNGAADGSQQEIVLDPESLESGATYDLRVYICNSSGQNRQVNLSFVGDGQDAVETGFFNEDDARTSAGGFKDRNQVYYINYRFTWDGDSTPGITITQKSGTAPFVLYALTNQLVPGGGAEATAGGGEALQAAAGEGGLSTGQVENESDEVGVESDDFYGAESLNSNGRWVNVEKWGKCWQPTNVAVGWTPYTNGNFQNCDDCGATFVSDEPWAWATYHYGRWCKVSYGCGWCWVPGKVWAGSWVSWRRGRTESCECIGWAPLPPEAGCRINVGISSWVDNTCNIGPECYTFINVVDFGRGSYSGCGCIYERSRNVTVIIDTFNCTNISHSRWGTYCGGVDFNWCNERIRRHGGKECENIHVNRYDDPGKMGGKFSKHEGNQLGLLSPHVKGDKNHKFNPKVADNLKSSQIDHGWGKDKKAEKEVRNHIANESKGKNPKNTRATLPDDVAQKMKKHHGGDGQALGAATGGKGHPGGKGNKGINAQNLTTGGQPGAGTGGFNQHPGGKGKHKGQGQGTDSAGVAGASGAGGFNQHPGGKGHKGKGAPGEKANTLGTQTAGGGTGAGGGGGGKHPGQSLKGFKKGHGSTETGSEVGAAGAGQGGGGPTGGGKGKHHKQLQGQTLQGGEGLQAAGQGGGTAGGGGKGGKHRKQQTQQFQQSQAQTSGLGQGTTAGGGGGKGGKHRKQQTQQFQQSQAQTSGLGQGTTAGAGGGKGGKHRKQQTQQFQQSAGATQGYGQPVGGGKGQRHQQQQFQSGQQPQGGGKKHKGKATPTPPPF